MEGFLLLIWFWIVGSEQEVVHAHTVVARQLVQDFIRQRLNSRLQIAVFPLGNTDGISHLLLGQVVVFPQIPDSVLHSVSLPSVIDSKKYIQIKNIY